MNNGTDDNADDIYDDCKGYSLKGGKKGRERHDAVTGNGKILTSVQ